MFEYAKSPEAFVKVLTHYGVFNGSYRYKVVCPFHEDKNASLLIDVENASWFCFGCQKGGRAEDFVGSMENDRGPSMWRKLFSILKSDSSRHDVKIKTKKQIQQAAEQDFLRAQDYYFNLKTVDWLKENGPEKQYMLKRGFDAVALNKVKAKLTYNESYPIIFPMNDAGMFKGWVCRTMDPVIESRRKYLYNKGFSRSDTVVGKYNASTVMIVEGFMDYLKAKQLGVEYVAALLGWKASMFQIDKLKAAGVKLIICALDNDECGAKGLKFLSSCFDVIPFQYPTGVKDIGEMDAKQFADARAKTKAHRRKKNESNRKNETRNK